MAASYAAAFSFFAFRASRYFLILLFATSLCFEHTIPKTGAAVFSDPRPRVPIPSRPSAARGRTTPSNREPPNSKFC